MTYIAQKTDTNYGMVYEQAYAPENDECAKLLCQSGHLIKYDETIEPKPGKKVHLYEEKSYLADLLIVRDSVFYTSTCVTSTTFIYDIDPQQSEWFKV